jgi:hypothetical protein
MAPVGVSFGLDLKFTPDERIAVIDMDGRDAPLWEIADVEGEELLEERARTLELLRSQCGEDVRWVFLGERDWYDKKYARTKKKAPYPHSADNPLALDMFCRSKDIQRQFFPQDLVPPWTVGDSKNPRSIDGFLKQLRRGGSRNGLGNPALIDVNTCPFVVLKTPWDSANGEGVSVCALDDDEAIDVAVQRLARRDRVLMEGFTPSVPVHSSKTEKMHDATVLLAIDALVDAQRGEYSLLWNASIWRLCGAPMDSSKTLSSRFRVTKGHTRQRIMPKQHDDAVGIGKSVLDHLIKQKPELFQ